VNKRISIKFGVTLALSIALALAVVAGGLWTLYKLEKVLVLLALAVFFSYMLSPLVEIVQHPIVIKGKRRRIPRTPAIAIVYCLLTLSLALIFYVLVPRVTEQVNQLIAQSPQYTDTISGWSRKVMNVYQRYRLSEDVKEKINEAVGNGLNSVFAYLRSGLPALLESIPYLTWLVLIPILSFFFLKDAAKFRTSFVKLFPNEHLRWRADQFIGDVSRTLSAYIRAQLTASVLIGTFCTIGFWIIGLPYVLVLGILAGLLEFIPLLGPFVLALTATAFAGFISGGHAVAVIVFLGALRVAQDYVIYPRIIGQGIDLHPLAIVLAVLCGAELGGVGGIFIAIPVIAIISVCYRHWREYRAIQNLVAESAEQKKVAETGAMQP
jgi:predicted PurR-regulated permease PerM